MQEGEGLEFASQRRHQLPWADRALMPTAARFGPDRDGFEILVTKSAVHSLRAGTLQRKPLEAFGLLMGRAQMDQAGPYTVVTGVVYATTLSATPGHVKLTGQQMEQVRREARTLFPAEDQVGWTHSHQEPFPYSHVDLEEQRTWQEPYHVGILTFMSSRHDEPWALGYRGPNSIQLSLTSYLGPIGADDNTKTGRQPDKSNPFDPAELRTDHLSWNDMQTETDSQRRSESSGFVLRILAWICAILLIALVAANLVATLSMGGALTSLEQRLSGSSSSDNQGSVISLNWDCSQAHHSDGMTVTCEASTALQATNWIWDYGDGITGSGQQVTHTYVAAGTYDVHLNVITLNSTQNAGTRSVRVAPTACYRNPSCIALPDR